jgi:DNA-binding MarR family transcriptional regulator
VHPIHCPSSDIPILTQITRLRFVRGHELLSSLNLHPSQFHLLSLTAHADGLSQSELAQHLMIKPSTLTVMIGRLRKAGLISRKKDTRDGRIHRIYISERGREVLSEAALRFVQIEQETFSSFTEEERRLFDSFAVRIRDNLKQVLSCQ